MPMTSSICSRMRSGSAAGRSILLRTVTISWLLSMRLIDVGERLGLDALRRIDHQKRTFAGRQRTRDFIGKVDVSGRVDQVQNIGLAIVGDVMQAHGLRLDGDAALLLDIHVVENLLGHLAIGEAAGRLDQPVSQRRLAMVDMGDDRKIADVRQGRL